MFVFHLLEECCSNLSRASTAVILDDFHTIVTQMMHLRHKDENDVSMECTTIDLRSLTDTTRPGVDAYVTHGMARQSSSHHFVPQEDVLFQIQRLLVEKTTFRRNDTGSKTVILLPQDIDETKIRRRTKKAPSSNDHDEEEKAEEEYFCSMSGGSKSFAVHYHTYLGFTGKTRDDTS